MQSSKPDTKGGYRKSAEKRKLLAEQDPGGQPGKQTTITDLFSNNHPSSQSPAAKRLKPNNSSPADATPTVQPIPAGSMYNFSSVDSKNNASKMDQQSADSYRAEMRARAYNPPRPSNFTPHTGAKKLVVKNLRAVPRLDQERYFEKVWSQLDAALTEIFNNQKPANSLEELYRGAENVCRQGRASALAKRLQARCEKYISGKLLSSLLSKAETGSDVDVLWAVEEAWSGWNARLVTIRSIFYYLDQSFLLHSSENKVIYEMGLYQFRSKIFFNDTLKSKVLQGTCYLVELDRKEDKMLVDPSLLRRAIKLFHDLGVYTSEFEPCLIETSTAYFKEWADNEASTDYLATYVERCHNLIGRERARCDIFSLDRSTKQSISELLDRHLVLNQTGVLLEERDILGLLRTNNQIALEQLYSLLEHKDLGVSLKPAFSNFIVEEGTAIVFDHERESEMVSRLLQFKESLDEIWTKSFHRHTVLGHTLRESFEVFINKSKKSEATWGTDNPKPGEMIAKYVDLLLKGGVKAVQGREGQAKSGSAALADSDAEINRQLDQVLDLFRFVHGKDVFEAFYKNDLARRLLMGRSANDDAEKSMLARLKSECGSNFTHNLESMFKDMDLARDEMASYNAYARSSRDKAGPDLNVHVLSSSAWPSYPDVAVNIPPEIKKAIDAFEEHYHSKHTGRKLWWKHSLAHCQLKARFPKGDKEIIVSSFQAIALLLFNDVRPGETLSYPTIKKATGLSDVELKRTLQSLACAKYRVLSKQPKGRDVDDTDVFSFNSNFSDPKMRIKINQIQLKETKQENKTTHERVAADRHYETQAAIVRILKSRKIITHAELISEVIKATRSRGVLEPADIKKNIERLIDKEYLEREDGNRYSYVA